MTVVWAIVGLHNGLGQNRRRAIISIKDGLVDWRIYAFLWPRWMHSHVASVHSVEPNCFSFDSKFNEVCSCGSIGQRGSIAPDIALVPSRRQTIIWTNDDPVLCRIYASPGLRLLTHLPCTKRPPFWQTTISNTIFITKIMEFRFEFHWKLFPMILLIMIQHWFR